MREEVEKTAGGCDNLNVANILHKAYLIVVYYLLY